MYGLGLEARRRSSQHFLAGLGETRLVERVRAVERGGDGRGARRPVRAARGPRHPRRTRGDRLLRAADRLADADPERPRTVAGQAARDQLGRRAAQSGGHRSGAPRLGSHDPGFLRADRDDDDGRQFSRAEGHPRLDGPRAARLSHRPSRPGGARERPGRDRDPAQAAPGGSHARLPERRRRGRSRSTATTTAPATSPRATRKATSPMSAAPTTCSNRATTA